MVYWPPSAPLQCTLQAFVSAFESLGYEQCGSSEFREGFEKVALFTLDGEPTHAARLLEDGM